MRNVLSWSLAVVVAFSTVNPIASAQQPKASDVPPPPRLPANANALMKLEVAKVLDSPLGKELEWRSKLSKGYADRPLAVPFTAKRMTVVAGMNPHGMRAIWQAAVIELTAPVRLEPMLREQGGYLDKIGDKQAAWTPHDVFYVEFEKNTLGVVRPGLRQYVTRWVTGKNQPELSPYLARAWSEAAKADVMFAMDLDEIVGATAIMFADSMGDLPSLEKIEEGHDKLVTALASVQGLRLTMTVGKTINAQFVIDFGQDVSALGANAKPFVMDVFAYADLDEPAIEKWKFKASGKQIVGSGELEAEALIRLIALLGPPSGADAVAPAEGARAAAGAKNGDDAAAPPPTPSTTADPKQQAAVASQKYYRAISDMLDGIGNKGSPSKAGSWFANKARRIEQLPLLHVDPALIEWGNLVSTSFNQAAQELLVGQQKATVAAQGIASPTAYTSYSAQGGGTATAETRAAYRNAQQARREAAQNERGVAGDRALSIMNQILPTRGKIRADMTQKYGVEF